MNSTPLTTVPALWRRSLEGLASRGSVTPKALNRSGLYASRQAHWGQFWTPDRLASFMWDIAAPYMAHVHGKGRKVRLFDNSVGSARLFSRAAPDFHSLAGLDIDGGVIEAVGAAAMLAGFECDFRSGSMTDYRPSGYDVALINPAFSLNLLAPALPNYPCCSHGLLGPRSSALSHLFALHQALEAASLVVAILPSSAEDYIRRHLNAECATIHRVPAGSFRAENADVDVIVAVLSRCGVAHWLALREAGCGVPEVASADACMAPAHREGGDSIQTPVTGDNRVRLFRSGRRVRLGFRCGLIEAKVLNALYRQVVVSQKGQRLPAGVRFDGEGVLDVEILLSSDDPLSSVERLSCLIEASGGAPAIDPDLTGYLRSRLKRLAIERVPLHRVVSIGQEGGLAHLRPGPVTVAPLQKQLLNPTRWGSLLLSPDDRLPATLAIDDGRLFLELTVTKGARSETARLVAADAQRRFRFDAEGSSPSDWVVLHPGRAAARPAKAAVVRQRLVAAGVDQWTWGYQFDDIVEMAMTPGGVVGGQRMGLGKTRIAAGLVQLGGKHNLFVVEASLLDEIGGELKSLGLPPEEIQIIDRVSRAQRLTRYNLISFPRLRMALGRGSRQTYAHVLRGRIHTLLADEGHCIANSDTDQVRALYTVNPQRRYAFSGTAIANYPRNLLPLAVWAQGDGTAAQPYGLNRPFIDARLLTTMSGSERGVDVFRERFVTLEWVTNRFLEDLNGGSKREVPVLRNVDLFREFSDRLILRRVWEEPAVAKHVRVPKPKRTVIDVDWDDAHLKMYLDVCQDFAAWWREERRKLGNDGRNLNLVSVLARIGAVETAATYPQGLPPKFGRFRGLTSKQEAALQRIQSYTDEGRKSVVFAESPHLLRMMHRHLADAGVPSVEFTGLITRGQRSKSLANDFKPVAGAVTLLASLGVGQAGHNLPMASRVLFLNRSWSQRQEEQAEFRVLRPQQKETVEFEYLRLPGSIDDYQAQMLEFKVDAAAVAIDHKAPTKIASHFLGWLEILDRFCEELSGLRGVSRFDLRNSLGS